MKGKSMRSTSICLSSLLIPFTLAAATPAFAQDSGPTDPPKAVTVGFTAAVVSDYRFRGISQTDKRVAVQGSVTVTHESGLYASIWASNVAGYVIQANNAEVEIDLIAGFRKTFGGTTIDVAGLYYLYPQSNRPGDRSSGNYFESSVAVTQTIGPVSAKAMLAYAPKQKALRLDQTTGPNRDNVYLAGDLSLAIPNTPVSLTAHVGHSFGPSWLTIGREYTDYSVGATVTYKMLTFGLSYVDADGALITPSGRDAAKGGVVASLTASF